MSLRTPAMFNVAFILTVLLSVSICLNWDPVWIGFFSGGFVFTIIWAIYTNKKLKHRSKGSLLTRIIQSL